MVLALSGAPLILVSIIAFILILGVIICIHELGHLIFAKKAGILCHEFSFGMGPQLVKKKKGETTYSIRAIPIGGFVSMAGEEQTSDYWKTGLDIGLNFDGEEVSEIVLDEALEASVRGKIVNADLEGKDGNPLYITLDTGIQEQYYVVKNDAMFLFENKKVMQIEPYNRTFDSKTKWQRFITLFAGPLFNFILAIFIYLIISFASGVPNYGSNKIGSISGSAYPSYEVLKAGDRIVAVDSNEVITWKDFQKYVDEIYETSTTIPLTIKHKDGTVEEVTLEALTIIQSVGISNINAEYDIKKVRGILPEDNILDENNNLISHGLILGSLSLKGKIELKTGDIITKVHVDYDSRDEKLGKVDGTFELNTWMDLVEVFDGITSQATVYFEYYSYNEEASTYKYVEASKTTTTYTNEVLDNQRIEKIIHYVGVGVTTKFDFFQCIGQAFQEFWDSFTLIFRTLKLLLFPSGVRQITVNNLSSVVGIFGMVKNYVGAGILPLLGFAAMLCVNIGIVNLLPIPALDGGRIVFLLVEAITKKKPSKKVEGIINTVFFILLLGLMVYITIHDIMRLF